MPETIQYPYSKKAGYAGLAVTLIFIFLLLTTCIRNYNTHDTAGTVIYAAFVLLIIAVMVLMIVTRLIPALKGEIALEIDENGVKDYIRNIILDWKDVDDIGLSPGRSSARMVFDLKFDSDFGRQVSVSLRWVEGRDSDIYAAVLAYFDEVEGIVRED
jgi:hypothetical protein